jgi:nucleotide-binding universal stress UspA family protein
MMKWVKVALFVAIALTLVNDLGRYIVGVYTVDDKARAIAFGAATVAKKDRAPNSAWPTAAKMAQEAGVEVIGYQQSATGVSVAIRLQITGTWLIGPINAMIIRKPLKTPFPVDQVATSQG